MFSGILFAILTGVSWVAVGAIIGLAEKRGCGTARQQLVGQTITGTISSVVLALGVAFRPESVGRIAIATPLMLSACLVGFAAYGAAFLRERPSRPQLLGTAFALAGIVLVAA